MNSYLDELLFRKLNAMCASYFDLNPIRNVLSGTETVVLVDLIDCCARYFCAIGSLSDCLFITSVVFISLVCLRNASTKIR